MKTLGLEGDKKAQISFDEIKRRYKELAHRWHPDRHIRPAEKAAAELEFKRICDAFASLQRTVPAAHEFVAIDPFGGVPWHHYTRYPPWSFSRGPPYAPGWFVATVVWSGILVCYSALIYDAANPAFGEGRVQRLREREAEAKQRKLAEHAEELARSNERSEAQRESMRASLAAALALKEARPADDARAGPSSRGT